jgi:hypothetical protein
MKRIEKNESPSSEDVREFLQNITFDLPERFIEFYSSTNGAIISSEENYTELWPLTEIIQLNVDYNVNEYAPEFLFFGSDGGDTAFSIEKKTGYIYNIPFIGMSKEEASFICKTFNEFLEIR